MEGKTKKLFIIFGIVFLIASFLFISPRLKQLRSDYHSSQLKQITTQDANVKRIDLVDENGKITIAADMGYATKIIEYGEDEETETYFDAEGNRVNRYAGYYGIHRQYDESGKLKENIYLDLDGNPIVTLLGYASETREYNENGQLEITRYFDAEGQAICSSSYGYGKKNEYNDAGQVARITYIDAEGNPMMTDLGYASVYRYFYESEGAENGKVESEFYFDAYGEPISLSLGQYGVHKEYNDIGKEALLTYLDAEGNPLVTNKGYTTVKRTYLANNSVATEQYYDINGEPFALEEGQYGVKKENGQTTYLNENGSPKFNIRNLFYNQSWVVIIAAVLVVLDSIVVDRKWNVVLLVLYLMSIVYLTLMFRESGDAKVNLELFWSYKKIFTDSGGRADILKNIWLFIPLGAILYKLYPHKRILLVPVLLSLLIELTQYVTGTGLLEFDDMVSNGLGGVIGYYAAHLLNTFKINSVFASAWNWIGKKVSLMVKGK